MCALDPAVVRAEPMHYSAHHEPVFAFLLVLVLAGTTMCLLSACCLHLPIPWRMSNHTTPPESPEVQTPEATTIYGQTQELKMHDPSQPKILQAVVV